MRMYQSWLRGIQTWASLNGSVRGVLLFGSRSRGDASARSDVDLMIEMMPPRGAHDWAFANYVALHDRWQEDLERIVGRHVSLKAPRPLWRRDDEA